MTTHNPHRRRTTGSSLYGRGLCHRWMTGVIFFLIMGALSPVSTRAQATIGDVVDAPLAAYDEIPVRVMIDGYKMFYIDAIYGSNKQLFINV